MMKKFRQQNWLWLTPLSCLVWLTVALPAAAEPSEPTIYHYLELFSTAITAIQREYVEDVTPKSIIYGALEGMLRALDPYSQFMDESTFKDLQVETEGEFGGVGIEISIRDNLLTIITPLDGTPADKAGLRAWDRIVRIDGEITKDMSLSEAVKRMRGKPGTTVTLTILREDEDSLLEIKVVRAVITIKAIRDALLLDEHVAYIKLTDFSEKTKKDLDGALETLAAAGMDSLILDLRNNPGGLLQSAVDVASEFLPSGTVIVSTKGRSAGQSTEFRATGKSNFRELPLVVLINGGSASASEIVAGAIQDNTRGIIIGTKSFGKGSVQTVLPLRDGSALRLTTAKYYTPGGRTISEKGIQPDIDLALIPEAETPEEEQPKTDIFEKINNQQAQPDATPDQEGTTEDTDKAVSAAAKLLNKDNQLQTAYTIMRGIRIDRSIRQTEKP